MYELEEIQSIVEKHKLGLNDLILTSGYSEQEVESLATYLTEQTKQGIEIRAFTDTRLAREVKEDVIMERLNVLYDIYRVAKYCKHKFVITTDYRDFYKNELVDVLKKESKLAILSWYLGFPFNLSPIVHLHKTDQSNEEGVVNIVDDDIIKAFKKSVEAFREIDRKIEEEKSK